MSTPAEVVADQFANAQELADGTMEQMETFTDALAGALVVAPIPDMTWEPVAEPSLLVAPTRPAALETIEAEFDFDPDGELLAAKPTPLDIDEPTLTIDEFAEVAPTITFPTAPTISIAAAPSAPTIDTIETPDAPTLVMPSTPSYLTLETPTLDAIDLHDAFLDNLDTVPTLSIVAPTPYTYTPGSLYTSSLLTALQAALTTRIAGGTGISTSVEDAIWDRMRERASNVFTADVNQVSRNAQAFGFHLPSDVTAAELRDAQRKLLASTSEASREVAVKQADLEQINVHKTIDQITTLERTLIERSLNVEQRAFESAKFLAQNAVDIHNARVGYFNALNQAYTAYANAYESIIKGELAKVEIYKAEIEAEKAKAQTNETLIRQYEAQIKAQLSLVELYNSQVNGAKLLVEIEGLKMQRFEAETRAYVAGVNGQLARSEVYKSQVSGQEAVANVYRTQALAFQAVAGAKAEQSRGQIAFFEAKQRGKQAEWEAWRTQYGAEVERIRAVAMKSQASLDGYKADVERFRAEVAQDVEHWQTAIKQYEAMQNYTLQVQKQASDVIRQNNNAVLEVAKVGSQVYSQLTASAWSIIRTSASVSADGGTRVSYQYQGDVDSDVPPVTTG